MSQYFPKPYWPFGADIIVRVDLTSYPTKTDIKNISHIHTSIFALTFSEFKSEVDKFDTDKLFPANIDLSKRNGAVKKLSSKN